MDSLCSKGTKYFSSLCVLYILYCFLYKPPQICFYCLLHVLQYYQGDYNVIWIRLNVIKLTVVI